MIFKKIVVLLALALVMMAVGACNEDDVKDIVEYNLTIENNTATVFDVWIDNPLSSHGYYFASHVAANHKTIIHELDIGIEYKVNLVLKDEPAEPSVHHRIVHSSSDDVIWTINP